jgi:hypothetical protein
VLITPLHPSPLTGRITQIRNAEKLPRNAMTFPKSGIPTAAAVHAAVIAVRLTMRPTALRRSPAEADARDFCACRSETSMSMSRVEGEWEGFGAASGCRARSELGLVLVLVLVSWTCLETVSGSVSGMG